MNDYENKYGTNGENTDPENGFSEASGEQSAENTAAASGSGENASAEQTSDGYTAFSDVDTNSHEENGRTSTETDSGETNSGSANTGSGYPYGANSSGSNNGGYPYGANNNGTNNGNGSYPYGANNSGSNNGGYPYGANNNGANNGNGGYPYGANNNGAHNGYQTGSGNPYPYANGMHPDNGYAYPPQNGSNGKRGKKGKTVFIVIAAVFFIFAAVGIISLFTGTDDPDTSTKPTDTKGIENVDEVTINSTPTRSDSDAAGGTVLSASAVYKKVKDSSVGLLVYNGSSLASEGSGVIFTEDSDGKYTYIITCAHVISDSGVSIMVQLSNGKEYKAEVVGYDTVTDIGVVRIEASGLSKAEIGDSGALVVGETVYAIGNPGGTEFANSFTNGIISAIDRPVSSSKTGYTMECIQHTAAINPGNSGGALVNEYGQLIGINSMKIVADDYEGMGFSVPSSVFVKVVNEIISNGYVTNRPKLGITYVAASSQQSYAMYAAIKGLPSGTIVIYSISDDSSFKNTKAQKGDMIIAVNGKSLDTTSVLSETIEKSNVGDKLTLTLVRVDFNNNYKSEQFDVTVTLVENRGDTYATEEDTTSQSSSPFDGSNGSDSDAYDYFKDYFDRYFGGNSGR